MHLCKLKEDVCEFHVLNKSQKIVICFDEQDGNVNKMDVIDETAGNRINLHLSFVTFDFERLFPKLLSIFYYKNGQKF